MISYSTEIYVDLFLLFLLYKFMKPQKILKDGRTEISTLLFVHDSKTTKKMSLNWNEWEEDKEYQLLEQK